MNATPNPQNLEKLKLLARDLRSQKPRPPTEALGGIKGAARTLDKCRATLLGINHDFDFNCPFDRRWFAQYAIDAEAFEALAASGATDEEVARWLESHAREPGAPRL